MYEKLQFFPVPNTDHIAEQVRQLSRAAGIEAYRDIDEPTEAERLLLALVDIHEKQGYQRGDDDDSGDWPQCVFCGGISLHHRDELECPIEKARVHLTSRGLLPRDGT